MNSLAARIIVAMLLVAFATIGIPAMITLMSAENQFREPRERNREFSEMVRSVEVLCSNDPPAGLVCPKPKARTDNNPRPQNTPRTTILPFVDPRPWVQQTVLIGVGISMVLATLLALLLARRISQPIQMVSSAAAQVAKGDLSARAKVMGQDELGQLAKNFNQMAHGLEQQEQARRNLFADIAHELRTPLTAMKARLEALEDGVMPLEMEAVRRLSNQTNLLERLVEDLRLVSLADAGALSLEKHPTDVNSLAREAIEHFRARAEAKNIDLELFGAAQKTAMLDTNRMQQAIGNLIENAIHHTPDGGNVRLVVSQEPLFIQLEVMDTGSGIPEDALELIFERLYRAESSRNRSTGGSGLGLAIVKSIVELHGGSIKASNQITGGAVFTLRIPVA